MARYKLSEVVMRIKDKVDKDNTELEYYIGGEHFDNGEICITKRGIIKESTIGPAFHMRFKPGDVLLMSRNPHLRKAGVVDFEGICSDVSYVCRTRDENVLMQRFLPFIFQTDAFWKFAEENKGGSTNFFLNWSDFERYEFDLPSIEEQRQLTDILWAAQNAKLAYKELLRQTDELVKSQFIELFGDPIKNDKKWPTYRFGDVATSRLGKMLDKKKQTGLYPKYYLANVNVQWFRFDLGSLNQMDFDEDDQIEFSLKDGDLLVCEGGEVGRCAIWHEELKDCYFQKAIHRVRCNKTMVLPEYIAHLFYYHSQINGFVDVVGSKATIAHLPGDKLKEMRIFVPPITLQNDFINLTKQTDKSKFEIKKAIENTSALIKSLMQQDLTN